MLSKEEASKAQQQEQQQQQRRRQARNKGHGKGRTMTVDIPSPTWSMDTGSKRWSCIKNVMKRDLALRQGLSK